VPSNVKRKRKCKEEDKEKLSPPNSNKAVKASAKRAKMDSE
jgi:hypothetical protein